MIKGTINFKTTSGEKYNESYQIERSKAEEKAKEEQERQAEELELKFVRERIAEFMLPPFNYDKDKALEIVQTERGKVSRAIKDNRITTDTTTAEMIAAILGRKS